MAFDKKQLEVLLINYFRECFFDFPKGKLSASESPDFILKMKNLHELGIELTRLNPANKLMPNEEQITQNQLREDIIKETQLMFERSSDTKLFVKFLFSEKKKLSDEVKMITSVRIVNAIREKIKGRNTDVFFYVSVLKKHLPEGVEEILIVNHPGQQNNVWERSNNLGLSHNVVDDIKQTILKKEEKLLLYQKQRLNYYWLLITSDRLRGNKSYNLENKILNYQFKSNFQKVFLFDLMKSNIYQLI